MQSRFGVAIWRISAANDTNRWGGGVLLLKLSEVGVGSDNPLIQVHA